MKVIETKLDELLVKKAPYQLPESGRKMLVSAMPWLALIGGILSVLGAWGVYQLAMWAGQWMAVANEVGTSYGYATGYTASYGPLMWVSLVLLLVEAVLFFMAFPALKERRKRGWDLVLWVSLLNVIYAVIYMIATPNLFSFIFSLAGSLVGLYLLFQVRTYYGGASTVTTHAAEKK